MELDRRNELKSIFLQTSLSVGIVKTSELLELIMGIEHLEQANKRLRIACQFVMDSLRNEDSAIEAQAEVEGKLGIYNPEFTSEIRMLLAALRNESVEEII